MKSQEIHQTAQQSRHKIDRATWQREAQEGELAYHKKEAGRRSDDFLRQSALLFESFGLYKDDYRGKVVIDLGAGSKLRSKYFSDSTVIAIEPLAERFMGEIAWCDLRDADEVYSVPAEERIDQCVDRANLVVSINVLDHCYDFERIIEIVCAYLKQDGLAFLSFDKHPVTDALHPLSLDEAACGQVFAAQGLVVEDFCTGLGGGFAGLGMYGYGVYRMNYWLRKVQPQDGAEGNRAGRVTLDARGAQELLCACLHPGSDETVVARLKLLSIVDWHTMARLAVRYRLASVLYKRLKALGSSVDVPSGTWRRLQDVYLNYAGQSMRLHHQLAQMLQAFCDEDIPVIVLKGAHLAQTIYGNAALRPMQDLDLLVRRDDLPGAGEKLLQMGYDIYGDRAEYEESHFHFHYLPPVDGDVPVEVHWHIHEPDSSIRLDIGEFWARARPANIAGVDVLTLSPEDLILYQCIHAALVHLLEGSVGACYDIAVAIQHYRDGVDWSYMQQCARRWGIAHGVYVVLRLARDFLAAAVPEGVLAALRPDNFDERLLAWAEERAFGDGHIVPPSFESINLAQFWTARRLRDKVAILLRSLFPAPQVIAKRYPAAFSSQWLYFYYLVNLKDMILEHTPMVWRLLRGDTEVTAQVEEKLSATRHRDEQSALVDWLAEA